MTILKTNERVAAQLQQRLDALLHRVGAIEGDLRASHSPDWVEEATERENDEVLEELDDMGVSEVQQIRGALQRIEDGTYGTCVACGKPIGAARLAVAPSAPTCIACAK